jgi:dGTPase
MMDILRSLFYRFMTDPHELPEGWDSSKDDLVRARLVADYVSGMTDRYALKLHYGS